MFQVLVIVFIVFLTGNESNIDLMLRVVDLKTREAVAAAISTCEPVRNGADMFMFYNYSFEVTKTHFMYIP